MATDNTQIAPGIVYFVEGSGVFAAGERVLVDPSDTWAEDRWLLVSSRRTGERFFACGFSNGDMQMLERSDGELLVYQEDRHEIIGVIVGAISPPPQRPSARR